MNQKGLRRSAFPFWELADQAIVSGARFLMMILVAKWGSQEALGLYSTGLNIYVFGLAVQESFLTNPLIILLPRMSDSQQARYAGNTFFLSILLSLLTSLLFLLGAWTVCFYSIGIETTWVVTALAIFLPFQLMREFNRRWLFLSNKSREAAISDGVFVLLQLAAIATLGYWNCLDAWTAILAIGIVSLSLSLPIYFRLKSDIQIDTTLLLEDLRHNVKVGRWFAGTNLLSVLQSNIIALSILQQKGSAEAGTYAACLSIAMLANPILLAVTSALAPSASRLQVSQGPAAVRRLTLQYACLTTIVMAAFTAGVYFCGDWIIGVAFKKEYQGNQVALGLASSVLIGWGLSYTVSCGLRSMDLNRADFLGAVAGLLVTTASLFSGEAGIVRGLSALLLGVCATAVVRWSVFFSTMRKQER